MLIDNIAPAGMKASYFSAQSLGWLGAAVNPLASGVILTTLPAWSLFVVLIIAIVFAWALMLKGMRITLRNRLLPVNYLQPVMCAVSGAPG